MKKLILSWVLTLFVLVSVSGTSAVHAVVPYCNINWGSLPKTAVVTTSSNLTNIRTGRHECYDRMVFDLNGPTGGYTVRYVNNVYGEGSGQLIPLSGGAKLQITLQASSYNIDTGIPTYPAKVGAALPNVNLSGYSTFRDAKFAGSFEGYTTVGLGVRAKLPFRVFTNGNSIVVDVAHYW